jgi:hypothetical protein
MVYLPEARWLDQRDRFRGDVLHAMDVSMTKIYALETEQAGREGLAVHGFGARDQDLPTLLKTLDWQFANNMAHLGFALEMKDDNQ